MYNLSVLSDKELEELAKDLLELKLAVDLQNFKKGRDKGIDLRYSADKENEVVIQVKHYNKSKFANLKHELLKKEKPKVDKLKPARYIIFTSLGLSPMEADTLKEGLAPHILSTNDIYGEDRILSLIKEYPEVEKKHYKLWLSSSSVMKKMLNNAIEGRSAFYEEKIIKKLSLYVPTQNYSNVVDTLKEKKVVLITGQPGVGKTTISYLLICQLLSEGFKLINVDDSIKEAENVLSESPDEKQVIFFDDFLGSNIYEIMNPRNSESSLVNFIERIRASQGKYLVLNTRTTILNQAEFHFEKFRRVKSGQNFEFEVQLKEYSKFDRAKILYNHIYHSNLEASQKQVFYENDTYLEIINHRNYSPRLVEFITSPQLYNSNQSDFRERIFTSLDNPNEIWKSAFESQLTEYDQFLLATMLSLGGYKIDQRILEDAYEKRLDFEIKEGGFQRVNDVFNSSIKKLLDSFIVSEKKDDSGNLFSLLNPSIGDFLISYLNERRREKIRVLQSLAYYEQVLNYFARSEKDSKDRILIDSDEASIFYNSFKKSSHNLSSISKEGSKTVRALKVYKTFFKDLLEEKDIFSLAKEFNIDEVALNQLDDTISILRFLSDYESCKKELQEKFYSIALNLLGFASSTYEFEEIFDLFSYYDFSIDHFLSQTDHLEIVAEHIGYSINSHFESDYREYLNSSDLVDLVRNNRDHEARVAIGKAFDDCTSDYIDYSGINLIEDGTLRESLIDEIHLHAFVDESNTLNDILDHEGYTEEDPYLEDYWLERYRSENHSKPNRNVPSFYAKVFRTEKKMTEEDRIRNLFDE